jgi:hypothetical protein
LSIVDSSSFGEDLMAISKIDSSSFLVSGGTGSIYKITDPHVSQVKEDYINNLSFNLAQNYPNPFNPSTVITYSLPQGTNVKLIVYNVLGEAVRILENGFKNSGNHSVSFNANGLSSGIYFYRIEAGNYSQIRKMILLK